MKKGVCRFWFSCPTHCLTRKPKINIMEKAKSISCPSYSCRRRQTKLTLMREVAGQKIFIDKNGETHLCVKFKNGKLQVCRNLEA